MSTLVGAVHSMVLIKGSVIAFAIYLACSVRGLVGAHGRVALLIGVASVRIYKMSEGCRLIGG